MSFARYFKLSSYCLMASGFVAIAASGTIGLLWTSLYGAALLVSWAIDTVAFARMIPPWLMNLIVLAYLPVGILDYRVFSHSLVLSVIHLALFVAILKLLTLAADRDYVYLYLISFAQLIAASALTIDMTFAFALLAFLISGVSTLVLFEIRRAGARALLRGAVQPLVVPGRLRGTGLELFSHFPARKMVGLSLAITLVILLFAVPLFVLLPRITLGVYKRPLGPIQMISGFSERVELGTIGTIKESDAIVMRVRLGELPAGLPPGLKWRGIALDHYDGRAWSRNRFVLSRVQHSGDYFKLENSIQGTQLLEQTFFLEPLSTDVVFAGHKVLAISSDLGVLRRDVAGNLYTLGHPQSKVRYKAVSDITPPDPEMIPIQAVPTPAEVRFTNLQVPVLDPRIEALAREITGKVEPPFEKARKLESYLRNTYAYSLELKGPPNSSDPLAAFLFDVRKGHCEYFASAMAVMLRQIGIPARLVNGFRAGEYNPFGDSFTVRQYDAHSWVEAWFEPYGWVEFDPTPPDPSHSRPAVLRIISDFVDGMGLWWWDSVVNYDIWKQVRVINATRTGVLSFQKGVRQRLEIIWDRFRATGENLTTRGFPRSRTVLLLSPALVLVALSYAVFRLQFHWASKVRHFLLGALLRRRQSELMSAFYREALDLLRKRGFTRAPGQTPLEFAASLQDHPAGTSFAALTHLYYRLRFGAPDAEIHLPQVEASLQGLRAALQPRLPRSLV